MMEALHRVYCSEMPTWLEPYLQLPLLERLKGVGMNCGCEYTSFPLFKDLHPYSRYDHSLGTALIVWKFTESRRQTLAALFHDAATPAFAHVVDFLQGDHCRQESTERGTVQLLEGTRELGELLKKDGIALEEVSDYHVYPVADNDSPRLSADRLEYTMGNLLNYQVLSLPELEVLYGNLTVGKNETGEDELCFSTLEHALTFSLAALKLSAVYTAAEDRYAMQTLADLLRKALTAGVLVEKDLWTTEPKVLAKLTGDTKLRGEWERFCRLTRIEERKTRPDEEGWRQIPAKKRWIDPMVLSKGRVSALNREFHQLAESFQQETFALWIRGI